MTFLAEDKLKHYSIHCDELLGQLMYFIAEFEKCVVKRFCDDRDKLNFRTFCFRKRLALAENFGIRARDLMPDLRQGLDKIIEELGSATKDIEVFKKSLMRDFLDDFSTVNIKGTFNGTGN